MSAKEVLKEIFESYESLKKICDTAKDRIDRKDHVFAKRLGIIPKSKNKVESKDIKTYFDSLYERIEEHYALELISTFEGLVFNRFGNAAGEIKKVVKSGYEKRQKNQEPTPLYHFASSFIKTKEDIRTLSRAGKILEKQISKNTHEKLEEIIAYRNWLSHGKNYGKRGDIREPKVKPEIKDIHETLGDIIKEAGLNSA